MGCTAAARCSTSRFKPHHISVPAASHDAGGCIAVDAMGSDLGPPEFVEAVRLALNEFPDLNPITFVGDEGVLRALVKKAGLASHPKIGFLHASEVVTMDDKPLMAIKRKKDASMF